VGLTVATARRPRRLCDLDAAALASPPQHPDAGRATNPFDGPIGSLITSADGQDACRRGRIDAGSSTGLLLGPISHWAGLPIERLPSGGTVQRDLPAR